MYLEHFGLREVPFSITPHTEFFFTGANRGATLEALIYAATHDEGIIKISGEVGSGKTMLCRMLLERLPRNVDTVYLANPSLSREDILFAIADELGLALTEGRQHTLLRALQERLIDIYASGRQIVIVVDEAHAMPGEALEEIRLLSNLETNRHKLLHIVLFGQPELDARLADPGLRQLKERITHNFILEPLRFPDIAAYLDFRLRAAGYRGPELFTPGALRLISHASQGLTRRINILADKALLSAFADNQHQIGRRQIEAAIRDAQFKPMRGRLGARPLLGITLGMTGAAIAALAFLAGSHYMPARKESAATAPPAREAKPQTLPTAPAPATNEAPTGASPALSERLATGEEWLKNTPRSHYFIQLLRTEDNDPRRVEIFLANETAGLDPQLVRVYRSRLSGRDRYGVIYGDFATRAAAQAELDRLLQANPTATPYIRSVGKLR